MTELWWQRYVTLAFNSTLYDHEIYPGGAIHRESKYNEISLGEMLGNDNVVVLAKVRITGSNSD